MNRRIFMQQAGIFTAGVLLQPGELFSHAGVKNRKIGLQLYTLRNEMQKGVAKVLADVAQAGYQDVETYGYSPSDKFWGLTPSAFSELLRSNRLYSYSGHYGMNDYLAPNGTDDNLKAYIEAAGTVGQKYITVPHIAGALVKDADAYKQIAEKLNKAGELCKGAGLKIAYHNHAFEFTSFSGVTGYDLLLKETDPSLVFFELDLYWAVKAGHDPVQLFTNNAGRFVMWHVKDMDKNKPEVTTEAGSGSIDFKKIFKAAKRSGLEQLYVEQEHFAMDPFDSIRKSYGYVRRNWG